MAVVTFTRDFSVPPYRKNKVVLPQLHFCRDDTVELTDEDKTRVDARAKDMEEATPYKSGEHFLNKNGYVGPRPDSPSATSDEKVKEPNPDAAKKSKKAAVADDAPDA